MTSQQAAGPEQPGTRIRQPDLHRLTTLFSHRPADDRARLLHDFLCHAIGLLNAAGAVVFVRQDKGLKSAATLLSRQALAWAPDMEKLLAETARSALAADQAITRSLAGRPGVHLAACPLGNRPTSTCLTLVFRTEPGGIESFLVIAQLLAAILDLQMRMATPDTGREDDAALMELVAEALNRGGREGILHLTAGLRDLTGCDRVALGCRTGKGRMTLVALSDISTPDRRTQQSRAMEKGLAECSGRGHPLCWPAPEEAAELDSPVLAEIGRSTGSGCVAALPLAGDTGTDAGLLLLWQQQPPAATWTAVRDRTERTGSLLAATIQALHRRPWQRQRQGPQSGPARRLLAVAAVLALLMLMLVPFPYRVPATAQVRPLTTRYVVARFDTILDKVLVDSGDRVRAGEPLARLDGREITLRLAALTAEQDKAARIRDRALAQGDTPAAQIARLDMERLDQQIKLLRTRQQHLLLVSPVDGIVLTGDLKRAQGGPVTKGQTLFEVAPLKKMDIELAIDEEDIGRIRSGMAVGIRFDAYPDHRWQGTIDRIIPKSRIRDMRNVFIAELTADNSSGRLRPGMRGEARIDCGHRSLGWILLHRPWTTLLRLSDLLF